MQRTSLCSAGLLPPSAILPCCACLIFPFSRKLVPARLLWKEKSNPTGCVGLHFCGGEEEIRPTAERVSVLTKRSVQRRVRQRCCPRHFMPLNLFLQNKKALIWVLFLWRRRRDSNSWTAFDGYAISSRAPSTKLGDFSIRYIFNFKWVAVGSQWKTKPFPPTVHGYSTLKTQRDDYISPKRFWQAVEQFYFIFFDLYVFNWVLNKTENVSDFGIVLKT